MQNLNAYNSAFEVPEDIDALVILGKQLNLGFGLDVIRNSPDHLSPPSRFNVIAGGTLWTPDRRLIISGSDAAYFPDAATTYIKEHFRNIPAEAYASPDRNSKTIRASAEHVATILKQEGLIRPVIVSVGKHGLRAAEVFAEEGVNVVGVAVADSITGKRTEHAGAVREWQRQPTTIVQGFIEDRLLKIA